MTLHLNSLSYQLKKKKRKENHFGVE